MPFANSFGFMTKLNAAIKFDGKWFVARCLDLPVTSQGTTIEDAKSNLAEAIELYIETWGADELETSVGEPELAKVEVPASRGSMDSLSAKGSSGNSARKRTALRSRRTHPSRPELLVQYGNTRRPGAIQKFLELRKGNPAASLHA
jgi:predicted RNase H-like HicB family nuclease